MATRKHAIITVAGSSTRFSKSVNQMAHKSLWPVPALDNKCLLEWQIRTLLEAGIEDIVVVTGYMADEVYKAFDRMAIHTDWYRDVHFIYNPSFSTTGSYLSMYLGFIKIQELIKNAVAMIPDSVILIEGDVYASNLKEFCMLPPTDFDLRPTTNGKSVIRADRDVLGIVSKNDSIYWAYDPYHEALQIPPSFAKYMFNSGQIWEINWYSDAIEKIDQYGGTVDEHKTNLSFIEFFGSSDEPFELKNWTNANTIEDINNINK